MHDVLIYADTRRSPELRHEVPVSIQDPFLYAERNGSRHLLVSGLEAPRLEGHGFELHGYEEFGIEEQRRSGAPWDDVQHELCLRAVRALGLTSAVVPADFPLLLADRLRAAGVELRPDSDLFAERRRVKNAAELAGIRRAQAAAEAGMAAARSLLRRALPERHGLTVDRAPLTCEHVRGVIAQAFVAHGASADSFIVSHGAQSAIGHHTGEGRILPGEPVIIDLWPRDDASACSSDMTRTFVVGEIPAQVADWHRLCLSVLDRIRGDLRPGVSCSSVFNAACDVFEAAGYPTQRTKADGERLEDGFFHALGHGVGLRVHERPTIGLAGRDRLRAGEVIAIEPGLYRPGFGGCRLEDVHLITPQGTERITNFPYDLTP